MQKIKLIFNPVSGRGSGASHKKEIEDQFKLLNLNFNAVLTEKSGHAVYLARNAVKEGFDMVVAAGGDGTINEVINGLMLAKQANEGAAALGVICVGRGNDFAYGVGIPNDINRCCEILADNHRRTIDVGHVIGGDFPEGRFFGNGVGMGFDAIVGFEALKLKWLNGFPSYIVAAIKTMFLYFNAPLIELVYNGKKENRRYIMVSVMNGKRMGGGFMMAPEGNPGDGRLNLCLVKESTRRQILKLMGKFMKGTQADDEKVVMDLTDELTIRAVDGTLPAHADGETLCEKGQKLQIKLLPSQLKVICPR
ncbi:diacylglycerol kinase family lipid kinase [candidate division KSB1 bacterium]|nr:diacylglycerol kinase family lipid kinase [candidate division KSB1 bacterium]